MLWGKEPVLGSKGEGLLAKKMRVKFPRKGGSVYLHGKFGWDDP